VQKNNMQATGSLTVPVLRYGFGFINWHQEEIRKQERKNYKNFNHPWTASSKSRY
jgi:hypothetical protein